MIYTILKKLAQLTVKGYFNKLSVSGKEHIPDRGPVIVIANHPSAFMDPIVVATTVKFPLYFIAAGEYVGNGLKGWLFQNIFHMIPVFRPDKRPTETHKNKEMFSKCYEHLNKEGSLLIFPEGVSLTEKKLKPLKTGTIRIALGAQQQSKSKHKIAILPIGLNYSDPHTFRSNLFIKISEPVYLDELDGFKKFDSKTAEIEFTKEATEVLHEKLRKNLIHLESKAEEELLNNLFEVYSRDIKSDFSIELNDQEGDFYVQQDFSAAINHFKENSPLLYEELANDIKSYIVRLNELNISDQVIGEYRKEINKRRMFSYILGLPLFIFGFVNNYIPYRLTGFITDRLKINQTFSGSIRLAIGLFMFLFWYILISILVGLFWMGLWAVIYPVTMYISGIYCLIYDSAIRQSKKRNQLRFYSKNKREIIVQLMGKRLKIIESLKKCKADFLINNNRFNPTN